MNDFNEVRVRVGGLKGLMRKLGDAPAHEHKWKSLERCPFCDAKGKAGVFHKKGTDYFKCFAPGCSSGNECVAEVGYVRLRKGLGEEMPATGGPSPAYKFLLELAGCYEAPRKKEDARPGEVSGGSTGDAASPAKNSPPIEGGSTPPAATNALSGATSTGGRARRNCRSCTTTSGGSRRGAWWSRW